VSRIDLATNEAVRVPAMGLAAAATLDGRYGDAGPVCAVSPAASHRRSMR
jgi:hypothetical protein